MALLTTPESIRLFHDVLVKSDTEADNEISINQMTFSKDTTYDPHRSKRIYAEVVQVPFVLKRTRIHQEEHLHPVSRGHFPGEAIERHANVHEKRIQRPLQVKEQKKLRLRYNSGHYSPPFTSIDDQPIQGKPGDKVYFHYLALSDDSYMGQDPDHNRYYRVPYDSCFCFVRGATTLMVNGYMQVEPFWNEDYQEIEVDGKIVRGKLKGNLVVGMVEAPEYRTGTIRRRGLNYGADTRDTIEERDIVIYSKGSEFKNTVEGKEVYLMQQWNIIAKREDKTFIPVGDYVHLRVKQRKGIIMSLEDVLEDTGVVLAIGENCNYVTVGDTVQFNVKAEFFNIDDTILLREGQILAKHDNEHKA